MYNNLIYSKLKKITYSEESPIQCDSWNDETCDTLNIEETDRGYQTSVNLPSAFFKHIIGRKGETKRRLEIETKTQIKIPREGVEGEIGQYTGRGCDRYIIHNVHVLIVTEMVRLI